MSALAPLKDRPPQGPPTRGMTLRHCLGLKAFQEQILFHFHPFHTLLLTLCRPTLTPPPQTYTHTHTSLTPCPCLCQNKRSSWWTADPSPSWCLAGR